MTRSRASLICLCVSIIVGVAFNQVGVTSSASAGEGMLSTLKSLPQLVHHSHQAKAKSSKSSTWKKPWKSISKWKPHWPLHGHSKNADATTIPQRPASDAWNRDIVLKKTTRATKPLVTTRPKTMRRGPAPTSWSQLAVQANNKTKSLPTNPVAKSGDPAPLPPSASAKAQPSSTRKDSSHKTQALAKSKQAKKTQLTASGSSLRKQKTEVPVTQTRGAASKAPASRVPASTTAHASRAVTKTAPSRQLLAPTKYARRTPGAKTQTSVTPTTLAHTRVGQTAKPSPSPRHELAKSEPTRRIYPRTHRKPVAVTRSVSKPAPVVDVATYRQALVREANTVRTASSTTSVAGTQTAPTGSWLATYQQLVRQQHAASQARAGRTSRRRTANR